MLKKMLAAALFCEAMAGLAFAGESVPIASCDTERRSMGEPCQAYIGTNFKQPKMQQYAKNACDNAKSKWALNTACPAQNRVGICKMNAGTGAEIWDVYYAQQREAANACTTMLHGKWSAQ